VSARRDLLTSVAAPGLAPAEAAAVRRGRRLAVMTVAYNALEAAISITAGVLAGSTALLGFGLDSHSSTFVNAARWNTQSG
jgi:divalent metal cation (Fe/Co/Zn/Cd) transporter